MMGMEHGLTMIVVDYLQLLRGYQRRNDSRQQEVSEISRELKVLAKEFNIPVLALSQLNRSVEHRKPPIPQLSDLRESGSIEQDADVIMFIYRGDIYEPHGDNGTKLIIAKQRNGPVGEVRLAFHKTYARFDNMALSHQQSLAG
jgi:replicative DNA helicase